MVNIILALCGLYLLIVGKLKIQKNKRLVSPHSRILGGALMLPLADEALRMAELRPVPPDTELDYIGLSTYGVIIVVAIVAQVAGTEEIEAD